MPREIHWTDAEEIGIQLAEKFPGVDPLTVRFTDLHRFVTELEGFADDPARVERAASRSDPDGVARRVRGCAEMMRKNDLPQISGRWLFGLRAAQSKKLYFLLYLLLPAFSAFFNSCFRQRRHHRETGRQRVHAVPA